MAVLTAVGALFALVNRLLYLWHTAGGTYGPGTFLSTAAVSAALMVFPLAAVCLSVTSYRRRERGFALDGLLDGYCATGVFALLVTADMLQYTGTADIGLLRICLMTMAFLTPVFLLSAAVELNFPLKGMAFLKLVAVLQLMTVFLMDTWNPWYLFTYAGVSVLDIPHAGGTAVTFAAGTGSGLPDPTLSLLVLGAWSLIGVIAMEYYLRTTR